MRVYKIILISLLAIGTSSQGSSPLLNTNVCRFWCRNHTYDPWSQLQVHYYCCDSQVKTGNCPPIRSSCPVTVGVTISEIDVHAAPSICQNDNDCAGINKCCYDQCLQHLTCKPAE